MPMDVGAVTAAAATRAVQAVRVETVQELLVAGLLVLQVEDREVNRVASGGMVPSDHAGRGQKTAKHRTGDMSLEPGGNLGKLLCKAERPDRFPLLLKSAGSPGRRYG